jgi:hypothetical protein
MVAAATDIEQYSSLPDGAWKACTPCLGSQGVNRHFLEGHAKKTVDKYY